MKSTMEKYCLLKSTGILPLAVFSFNMVYDVNFNIL